MSRLFLPSQRASRGRNGSISTPLYDKGVQNVYDRITSTALRTSPREWGSHGYEDAATLRWQQACVQAANTLTASPNGRYVSVRMERMRQGLELAQRGAVTLPEDGEDLSAVVRSGHNVYQVDTRLLTCPCADYQKHLQACKHLLAVEIHLGALGLLPPSAPEPAAAEEPAPVPAPAPRLRHRARQAGPSAKRPPRSTSSSRSAPWNSCSPCATSTT